MNSGTKLEVGQCECCKECRHLQATEVPVVELHLIMMSKTFIKTGRSKTLLLCGICADKVQTGLSVMDDGGFIMDGKHYTDLLKEEKSRTARLW